MSGPGDAADALAVANLKARYCRAADAAAGDPAAARALLAPLFADGVEADYGYGPLTGTDAIADFLCTAIAGGSAWMAHMLHSPLIEVTGDEISGTWAAGEWAVSVHSLRLDTGERSLVIGRYADRFRRTGDGWRIARIGFTRIA